MAYVEPSAEFLNAVWADDRKERDDAILRMNADIRTSDDFYRWYRSETVAPHTITTAKMNDINELRGDGRPWCAVRFFLYPDPEYSCGCRDCNEMPMIPRDARGHVMLPIPDDAPVAVEDEWGASIPDSEKENYITYRIDMGEIQVELQQHPRFKGISSDDLDEMYERAFELEYEGYTQDEIINSCIREFWWCGR